VPISFRVPGWPAGRGTARGRSHSPPRRARRSGPVPRTSGARARAPRRTPLAWRHGRRPDRPVRFIVKFDNYER